jgi:DNA gyrase subunit A
MMKIVDGGEFDVNKRTVSATKLGEDDRLVSVHVLKDRTGIVLQSKEGFFLRFLLSEIPDKKKGAVGVRGMKLGDKDSVESVYYINSATESRITVKDKEINLNALKMGKRDGKGTKIRS